MWERIKILEQNIPFLFLTNSALTIILINNIYIYIPIITTISMKINITIPNELYDRIQKYRKGTLQINISKICSEAIKKKLDELENE